MVTFRCTSLVSAAVGAALLAGCATSNDSAFTRRVDLLGTLATDQSGQRTIILSADTVSVNVTSGETVRFIVGERSFAWNFQVSPTITMFELNQVAPAGLLTHRVAVYVSINPLYISNS